MNGRFKIVPSKITHAIQQALDHPVKSFFVNDENIKWMLLDQNGSPDKYLDKYIIPFTENHFAIRRLEAIQEFLNNVEIYLNTLNTLVARSHSPQTKLTLLKIAISDFKPTQSLNFLNAAKQFFQEASTYLCFIERGTRSSFLPEENTLRGTYFLEAKLDYKSADEYEEKCATLILSVIKITETFAKLNKKLETTLNGGEYKHKLFDNSSGNKKEIVESNDLSNSFH